MKFLLWLLAMVVIYLAVAWCLFDIFWWTFMFSDHKDAGVVRFIVLFVMVGVAAFIGIT